MDVESRHTSTRHVARYFSYDHLTGDLALVSRLCHDLAEDMVNILEDGPELTAGLRKLLEAKDCFVRSALDL